MFQDFLAWRIKNGVDLITDTFTSSEVAIALKVQEIYPHNFHKVDKEGLPIYIERMGMIEIDRLFELTTEENVYREFIHNTELSIKLRFPVCSELYDKKVETDFAILDLQGLGMKHFNKRTKNMI